MYTIVWRCLILSASFLLLSCGITGLDEDYPELPEGSESESSDGDSGGTSGTVKTGVFLDSAISGIVYISGSKSGTTDNSGTFKYEEGQNVTFSVGGVTLGSGIPAEKMTPVDLVEGGSTSHRAVINIACFLQTLDDDGDPENGITITANVAEAASTAGRTITFDLAADDFSANSDVLAVVAKVSEKNGVKALVSPERAKAHLENTVLEVTGNPGILVSLISGDTTETGDTATFTVKLNSQPSADVTIAVSSSDATERLVSPSSLSFTSFNWNAKKTVTVTGVDDNLTDGDQSFTIVLAAAVSNDGNYNGLDPNDVSLTNTDDETAGFTVGSISGATTEAGEKASFTVELKSRPSADVAIGVSSSDTTEGMVSPSSLNFTSANWNAQQNVTVTGVDDSVADGNQSYTVVLAAAVSTDSNYSGKDPNDVSVTNTDDESAGFTVSSITGITTEAGVTASFSVKLNSEPTDNVTIGVSSSDTTEGTVSPSSLTFTSTNWNAKQNVTVTGVDDNLTDGDQSYTVVLAAAVSSDSNYSGLNPADVSVSNTDDETAGFTVDSISGNTNEGGGTATFTIKLNSEPTADVTIAVSSSDSNEGTVSPSSLTFTSTNWSTAQTVTVTGVDDSLADGDQSYTIVLGSATSNDNSYNGLNPNDVSVTNTDDETAGFTISSISGNTTEAGGNATFTVKLNSEPTADVTIAVSSSDTNEGTVSPSSLTFTSTNWSTAQTVTVTGVDDSIVDGNQSYTSVQALASSSDGNYNGLDPNDVSVTNTDNDANSYSWTKATDSAPWAARYLHSFIVFDNKMWILGGTAGSLKNDVWYSSDGISWAQATSNASWSGRHAHTSVVFNDKIWVIGG